MNRIDSAIDRALEIAESLPSSNTGAVGLTASDRPAKSLIEELSESPDTRVGRVEQEGPHSATHGSPDSFTQRSGPLNPAPWEMYWWEDSDE